MQSLLSAVNRMIDIAESKTERAKIPFSLSEEARKRDMKVSGTVKEDVTKEYNNGSL